MATKVEYEVQAKNITGFYKGWPVYTPHTTLESWPWGAMKMHE